MNSDINDAYQIKEDNTLIENVEHFQASKFDYDKNVIQVTLNKRVTMFDRFENQFSYSNVDKWSYYELISGKIVDIIDKKVFCECMLSRDNSEFQLRKFDISLFEHLGDFGINSYVKIKISQKPGSQRIDIIDGKGLGIENEFFIDEDSWNIFDEIDLVKPRIV